MARRCQRLRHSGCRELRHGSLRRRESLTHTGVANNIEIADAMMLAETLRSIPETLRRAGRCYAVIRAHVEGCFHPKVFLRFGSDRGCVRITSANATAAGWCRNLELSCRLSWKNDGNAPNAAAPRKLPNLLAVSAKMSASGQAHCCKVSQRCRMRPPSSAA